jgi:hypothetical protein
MGHYLRALVFAAKGGTKEAAEERKSFEDLRPKLDHKMQWGINEFGAVLDLAEAEPAARIESSPAADIQDHLAYDEPPDWYHPIRESWGTALLLSGDAAGAEAVFREGLRRSPKDGRMLFSLLESLKAQHKADDAHGYSANSTPRGRALTSRSGLEDLWMKGFRGHVGGGACAPVGSKYFLICLDSVGGNPKISQKSNPHRSNRP